MPGRLLPGGLLVPPPRQLLHRRTAPLLHLSEWLSLREWPLRARLMRRPPQRMTPHAPRRMNRDRVKAWCSRPPSGWGSLTGTPPADAHEARPPPAGPALAAPIVLTPAEVRAWRVRGESSSHMRSDSGHSASRSRIRRRTGLPAGTRAQMHSTSAADTRDGKGNLLIAFFLSVAVMPLPVARRHWRSSGGKADGREVVLRTSDAYRPQAQLGFEAADETVRQRSQPAS